MISLSIDEFFICRNIIRKNYDAIYEFPVLKKEYGKSSTAMSLTFGAQY